MQRATLDQCPQAQPYRVAAVRPPQPAPHWAQQLAELGFLPGEPVMLMARALPGGDPMVVRVGQSTFALRCAEAACVRVSAVASAQAMVDPAVLEGSKA